MSASKFCTRSESSRREMTRTPVFVVLVETAQLLDYRDEDRPDSMERDDDGDLRHKATGECCCNTTAMPPCAHCTSNTRVTFNEIKALRNDDRPVTIETTVEGVWLTRQEAEAWLASKHYNYRKDQHAYVYGVPADGELADVLRDGSECAPGGSR